MKRILLLVLIASRLDAATILIAPDGEMIRASRAVVVATAESSRTRWSDTRWIETVTTMHVEESMKGSLREGETFEVVELGGIVGETGLMVPGSPRFAGGERVLLLLETNRRGEWTAKNLSAGVFRLRGPFAVRTDLETREPARLAEPFLRFARKACRTDFSLSGQTDGRAEARPTFASERVDATPSITSYLITNPGEGGTLGIRWRSFASTVVFLSHGTQPGALNGGVTSVQRGLSAWTDDGASNILYAYGGTTARDSGFVGSDGVNSIQFNDPSNEIPGSFTPTGGATLAIGGAWFNTSAASTHVFNGERFYTISEADLIVQNGISGAGLTGNGFDHVLAHELGHTLGFRHSDEPSSGGTSSSTALMNSSVAFNNDPTGAALQAWDREAVAAVYGSGSTCSPPSITTQPQSVSVAKPEPITLSVAISSATQPAFQWFVGQRGVTSAPIAATNTSAITVQPQNTTSYWVRVANGCAPDADSDTATITIAGCPAVLIRSISSGATIIEGKHTTLTVDASGGSLTYQWFIGESGTTTSPIAFSNAPSIDVKPVRATKYWVRVTNQCGATSDSGTIAIDVLPCVGAQVVVEPVGGNVVIGDTLSIYASVIGTQTVRMQWFEGFAPDASQPLINGSVTSITTNPILGPTSFWLRVENDCGSDDSLTALVNVVSSCAAPQITQQPANVTVASGTTTKLTAAVSGTSLTYRWYQGPVFDFTKPVGGNNPSLLTPAITTPTEFWLHVTNPCGTASSTAVQVTPVNPKRRAI